MTVSELKEMLADLPDHMDVFMPHGDKDIITVCRESGVIKADTEETGEVELLLLIPCTCNIDDVPIDLEVNPN